YGVLGLDTWWFICEVQARIRRIFRNGYSVLRQWSYNSLKSWTRRIECKMVTEAPNELLLKEPAVAKGIKVAIHPEYPEQTIIIGGSILEKGIMELCEVLRNNLDIFAWKPADMTGVPRSIAEHRLNIRDGCTPIRQKRRGHAREMNKAIQEEVAKLMDAQIMREVHYHGWLVNPVMEILRDVKETFQTLRRINMKLNPKKCTFGAEKGMFLGHMVNMKGIKACPEKAEAVIKLQSPKTLKEVQSLNGKLASLKRAFRNMKQCIAELPIVTAPKPKEELIVYLYAIREAVSSVLLTERESQKMPVYFINRALQAPEVNYSSMEKLVLALVHASRRLRRYFQAHSIAFITDQPIRHILSQPENTRRLIKWKPDEEAPPVEVQVEKAISDLWTLFTDGSSFPEGSRARLILTNPEGVEFTYALRFEFNASNNEAKYEALLVGLRIAEQIGVKNLEAKVDSRLIANQINGSYVAKERSMIQYLENVKALISRFKKFSIEQVPRSENKKAGALSKIASTSFAHLTKQVLVKVPKKKSFEENEILAVVKEEGDSWMTPLLEYLADGTLPAEAKKARAVKIKSRQYDVINGVLYRKSFIEPWQRCVGPLQAKYEIHEGSCSMHYEPRSVMENVNPQNGLQRNNV
ncbi:reverse transcriptase domain-containing protein, partial [Tanacetum coccineum]